MATKSDMGKTYNMLELDIIKKSFTNLGINEKWTM